MKFALEFENIVKEFPGVRALKSVSFGIEENTIHALIGENGAGKSTLLKILGGNYFPESGKIFIKGKELCLRSVQDSINSGIAIIYQELNLVPEMTVYENIFLGHFIVNKTLKMLDIPAMAKRSAEILKDLDDTIDPETLVKNLPIGQRQLVEIAKSLNRGAEIFAFDEPTSSLSAKETEKLFAIIRKLHSEGNTIIYVSHRMEEIFELCGSLTVFRDGTHVVSHRQLQTITREELIASMLGVPMGDMYEHKPRNLGGKILQANHVTGKGVPFPVTFHVKEREILGFFGLVGAGRTELMKLIFGADTMRSGELLFRDKQITVRSPKEAIDNHIAYCSEDRRADGIVPLFSVEENINVVARQYFFSIKKSGEQEYTERAIRWLNIKTPNAQQQIKYLSGGNQQKCLLARWFSQKPEVDLIILDEPTRGIDVGAKKEIYRIISDLADTGKSIIVVSSELAEVIGICDRIITMCENRITGEFERKDFDRQRILDLSFAKNH